MIRIASAVLLAASVVLAQQPPTARQFLFDDHRHLAFVDLKKMRESGVWDDVEASALAMLLKSAEQELGFPLDHLDRLTLTSEFRFEDGELQESHDLQMFEGNRALALGAEHQDWREHEVGSHTLRQSPYGARSVVLVGNLRVEADQPVLHSVLSGTPRAGAPCADVLSLLADTRGLLVGIASDVGSGGPATRSLQQMLDGADWPEGDGPTFVAIRLRLVGEQDDPHLRCELVVRHREVGDGLAATEKAVTAMIEKGLDEPMLRMLHPVLKKIGYGRSGADAVWQVDLGRSREAIGLVGALVPMFLLSPSDAAAVEVVEVAEEVAPPPPPPPAEPEQGGGGREVRS